MKMDAALLQSDPEALDQISMRYHSIKEVSFLNRFQSYIKCHRFIQIIKVILYLELILAIGVVGCITLSNYYSNQRYNNDDIPYDLPAPAGDHNAEDSLLNSNSVPGERIKLRTKETDTIVSTDQSHISTESVMEAISDFVGTEKPTSWPRIITKVDEDNSNKINSDLSKVKEIFVDDLGALSTSPNSGINGGVPISPLVRKNYLPDLHKMEDTVPSNEDFDEQYDEITQLIQKLVTKKIILAGSDIDGDSNSWSDDVPSSDLKTKRSAESSSSESSSSSSSSSSEPGSSSSSSSESGSSESDSSNKEAIQMLKKILIKMEKSNCSQISNVNVTPIGERAESAKSLRKRLVKWILETPIPSCDGSTPSLAVDKCGDLFYNCPLHGIENERSEKHGAA